MNKYYGAGIYFKDKLPEVHRFKPNYSQVGASARINQRNKNKFTESINPKLIITTKHPKSAYKNQWEAHNNFSEDKSYYKHPRNAKSISKMVKGRVNAGSH